MNLFLTVEVAGCPTVCRHCWAQGTPYGEMPLADAEWILDEVGAYAAARGLGLGAYPMHEVAAHADAAALLRLFGDRVGADEFEPFSTTGVPLALRDDWSEVLETAAELGTTTVWLALHGLGEEHDRQVGRTGAYAETRRAIGRIHEAGLRVGCNVFVTKANLRRFDELADAVEELGIDEASWEPAAYHPTPRGRRYARLLPELDDLEPVAARVRSLTSLWRRAWDDLEAVSEARWVELALAGSGPEANGVADTLQLVCRPTLDVHTGLARLYGERHGNLRADGVEAVLDNALASGPTSEDELFFPGFAIEPVEDLAGRYGTAAGREVHFTAQSMRTRWLDRAAAA